MVKYESPIIELKHLNLRPHTGSKHVYEVRPRKDRRGVDLISDALPFGRLWYGDPNANSNAVEYAKFRSRSNDAELGNVIERTSTREILRSGELNESHTSSAMAR